MAGPAIGAPRAPKAGTNASHVFMRVLLAVDERADSPRVWTVVLGLRAAFGSELIVCHVVMRPTTSAGNALDGNPANPEETTLVQRLRARLVEQLGSKGHDTPIRILHGDAGQRICEYAEFARCDLIVLGLREKRSIGKLFRGSVSKYVADAARGSVLVVGE